MTTMVERLARRFRTKVTVLVPVVLLAIAWYLGPHDLPLPWLACGVAGFICGTALRLWASGYLIKDDVLVRWGPFRYTRNPLYLGTLLIGLGFGALTGRWESFVLVTAFFSIYLPTVCYEERLLATRFGDAFTEYARLVPRWIPRLIPAPLPADATPPYRWTLVRHHQEDRHFILHLTMLLAFVMVPVMRVLA